MDTQNQILLLVGQINGKLDGLIDRAERTEAEIEAVADRVGKLERWKAYVIGGAAGVGAIAGSGVQAVAKALGIVQ